MLDLLSSAVEDGIEPAVSQWRQGIHSLLAPGARELRLVAEVEGEIGASSTSRTTLTYELGVKLHAHQLSSGMLAYLGLLAAVLSPSPAAALGFDEPDLHLHPSLLRRAVSLFEQASDSSAVVVATHSDRMLDFLADPARSIRVCEATERGVELRRLDEAALKEWRERYSMSELRSRGQLDPTNADSSFE